jgi:carboxyl-terminal processing protease
MHPARDRSGAMRIFRMLALIVLIAFSTGFGAVVGSRVVSSDRATAATMLASMPSFDILEETYDAIREHYVLSDEITDEQLMYGAARGMIESLGDTNHSTFLDPEEAQDFVRELDSELIGIGIQVDLTGPLPVVIAPIDGSPAWEAGIQPGDVIVSVNGVESATKDPQEITDLIRGKEGTDVTLVLRHRDSEKTYEVTITRAKITLEPVSSMMLPDGVLWLRIARFSVGTTDGVREALQWGKAHGMTSVILDLRNNPGGYTDQAMGVGAQFLPAGSVLYKEQLPDGTVVDQKIDQSGGEWLEGDMVVLINGGSASAAEIVSSGLRDNGRARLYGETTVGTGTVLRGYTLSDGSMALLGTKLWLTANGSEIWKVGVTPDVEVALPVDELPTLPLEFEGDALTQDQLQTTDDTQLIAGFDALTDREGPVASPVASPAA